MTLFAVIASAFALTGTPAGIPVNCTPNVPHNENGWAWWSPSFQVELAPDICSGLDYLSGDESYREKIRASRPFTYWPGQAGVSALVLLHELSHIDGYHDETDAECRAMSLLPGFLAGYYNATPGPPDSREDPGELATALRVAASYDAMLPPAYHEHSC